MSIPAEKVAPLLGAAESSAEFPNVNEKRRRSRPYKARVATKIRWALGDVMDKTVTAQKTMRLALEWLKEQRVIDAGDNTRLARLGRLDHLLAELALDVSEMERICARAVAESRPEDELPSSNGNGAG